MRSRRYTVVIADRSNGVVRQVTVGLRRTVVGVFSVLALPVLMGLGAKWSARSSIEQLQSTNTLPARTDFFMSLTTRSG